MTPEAEYFLIKAEKLVTEAEAMLSINLYEAAGRTAYLAGFHAAQAYIFEKTGRSAKTHRGVQTELHRLTREDPAFDTGFRTFLSQSYNLKAIADYETGPGSDVSPERARDATQAAKRFVSHVGKLLSQPRH